MAVDLRNPVRHVLETILDRARPRTDGAVADYIPELAGGGIVAMQPDQFGIGTYSALLDARGNSVRGVAMLEMLSQQSELHLLRHRGEPLSPIASITPDGDELVAILRGEIAFAGAEELLTRLIPLLGDTGCLVLDFTAVTRVASGAAPARGARAHRRRRRRTLPRRAARPRASARRALISPASRRARRAPAAASASPRARRRSIRSRRSPLP